MWIKEYYGWLITGAGILSLTLEIGTKKIKPFSWLLGLIGKLMNKDLDTKVEGLNSNLKSFRKEYDIEKIAVKRKDISEFILSLQRNEKHTIKDYERILESIQEYHNLIDKYEIKNGNIEIETQYINKVYQKCLEEQKFFEG